MHCEGAEKEVQMKYFAALHISYVTNLFSASILTFPTLYTVDST